MKNFKYILLIAPVFLIAQNNLFFNRVLTFKLDNSDEVTVPANKAWNIKDTNYTQISFKTLSPEYGNAVIADQSFSFRGEGPWLGEGDILYSIVDNTTYSILEYDVIPISSGTTGASSTNGGFTSTTDYIGSGQYTSTNDYTVADSFTDIDGNEYGAVNVLGTVWATSNLKVTKFSDGTPIAQVFNLSDLVSYTPGYLINSQGEYLYNWYAINGEHDNNFSTPPKNLAPDGYRVTNYFDWKKLIDYYGGEKSASNFLISRDVTSYPGMNKAGLNLLINSSFVWGTNSGRSTSYYSTINFIDGGESDDFPGMVIEHSIGFKNSPSGSTPPSAHAIRVVKDQ